MSFEEDLKRLEEITAKLKSDDTGIEESLKLYEEASALNKKLTRTLEDVRRRIEMVDADGAVTEVKEETEEDECPF